MFQIEWTKKASKQRVDILEFWIEHNQSKTYSTKILKETLEAEKLLKENPSIGTITDLDEVRRTLILRNFSMFYSIENKIINILAFYDNRRNPDKLEL
ncbi:type II toxin-antitoxin system RelE/ParE family toxin [Epilithonimonas zeae]|uniref:type II toxin-antitoxin system RelE/ParE family toxin n=1 Tax=Epilithonimonas zeae TaxID=1416779 RepID=UPI00200E812E|nr:type II toxin-antitoxin system RelE/ParE family toxin [Epilithonimonas zeae]UQB68430.1 type II toxin-antitoxin system RelE/ParE family toxin [Epilithonimonas zeae]